MVLNDSGVCSLCGSEENAQVQDLNTRGSEGSVDLPFGLGVDPNISQPDLPFGIHHAPPNPHQVPLAKSSTEVFGSLPFGLEHIPNYDLSKTESVESDPENKIVESGVATEPYKNNENSPEKRGMSAINHDGDLPFGIEHIFYTPQ
tara:strand:- start:114 stop:551 length:438 start_codon:yes stop_codon:yes gene_type:complete